MLMGSGLDGAERAALNALAAASGGRVVSQWQPGVSHVVCGLDTEQRARHGLSSCLLITYAQDFVLL